MFGSFLPNLWSSCNQSVRSREPTLLCNHQYSGRFSGYYEEPFRLRDKSGVYREQVVVCQNQVMNPFKIGDKVVFAPNEHTVGWSWPTFERIRLKPGDVGIITRIERENYIYLEDEKGGFHWECFKHTG